MSLNKKISDDVKASIIKSIIEPSYISEISRMSSGKSCWKITGIVFETLSKISVAAGGILSFSSGYYNDPILSFMAGAISTISLAMLQFSSFSYKESKKQTQELNMLLEKLGLDTVPEMGRSSPDMAARMIATQQENEDDVKVNIE